MATGQETEDHHRVGTAAPLQLVIIVGSTREGRFGGVVGRWFADQARSHEGVTVDVIDLADLALPAVPSRHGPAEKDLLARIERADAYVVVTPEYNHGYPASLKMAIDLPHDEWKAKPVGFVSYGGLAGGLRAVEQLRQVFAELHAVTVRDTVSFHQFWEVFDETGQPREPEGPNLAAKVLLDGLGWWGRALRTARGAEVPSF